MKLVSSLFLVVISIKLEIRVSAHSRRGKNRRPSWVGSRYCCCFGSDTPKGKVNPHHQPPHIGLTKWQLLSSGKVLEGHLQASVYSAVEGTGLRTVLVKLQDREGALATTASHRNEIWKNWVSSKLGGNWVPVTLDRSFNLSYFCFFSWERKEWI